VRNPEVDESYVVPDLLDKSSQNLKPVVLEERSKSNLHPILVEASLFVGLSAYDNLNIVQERRYNLRNHLFPRVVLWNPYSVPLEVPATIAMMQVNGRRSFKTDFYRNGVFSGFVSWISWGGRTNTSRDKPITETDGWHDKYTGSRYFSLPEVEMEPGQCLVFLPNRSGEYNSGVGATPEEGNPNAGANLLNNSLSPSSSYLPENNYYVSASVFSDGIRFLPTEYWYAPYVDPVWLREEDRWFGKSGGIQKVQGEDSQMILKRHRSAYPLSKYQPSAISDHTE